MGAGPCVSGVPGKHGPCYPVPPREDETLAVGRAMCRGDQCPARPECRRSLRPLRVLGRSQIALGDRCPCRRRVPRRSGCCARGHRLRSRSRSHRQRRRYRSRSTAAVPNRRTPRSRTAPPRPSDRHRSRRVIAGPAARPRRGIELKRVASEAASGRRCFARRARSGSDPTITAMICRYALRPRAVHTNQGDDRCGSREVAARSAHRYPRTRADVSASTRPLQRNGCWHRRRGRVRAGFPVLGAARQMRSG